MVTKEDFTNAIFKGLHTACEDSFYFLGEPGAKIKPEYVVTVNIAKALFEIEKSGYGHNFKVKLEENATVLATACVLHEKDLLYRANNPKNTTRNEKGRVDIAVYETASNKPICAIEVKDFIVYEKDKLEADLKRNIELINLTHDTGEISSMNFAFLAFLKEYTEKQKKCVFKGNKEAELRAIENNYRHLFYELIKKHPEIKFTIEARTVAEDLLDDDVNPLDWETDWDFNETAAEKYHYIGVIITTERN